MINEVLQWAVMAFLAIVAVGLTRNLGRLIVPQREQLAESYGPPTGTRLPRGLLSPEVEAAFQRKMETDEHGWGLVTVVNPNCDACDAWIEGFERDGVPAGAPLVLLSSGSTSEHEATLRRLTDAVVTDGAAISQANLGATPFLMIVDSDLKVRRKHLGGNPHASVAEWRSAVADVDPRVTADNGRMFSRTSN